MAKKRSFAGKPASIENIRKLFETSYMSMVFYLFKKTGGLSDAEDIVMDVFDALLTDRPEFATDEEAANYLKEACDECFEQLKKEQGKVYEVNTELAIRFWDQEERNVAMFHQAKLNQDILQQAMDQLPEEQRHLMKMHLYEEKKMNEIAIRYGINLQSAYNKKSIIVKKLKWIIFDLLKNKR